MANEILRLILTNPQALEQAAVPCALRGLHRMALEENLPNTEGERIQGEAVLGHRIERTSYRRSS